MNVECVVYDGVWRYRPRRIIRVDEAAKLVEAVERAAGPAGLFTQP